MNEDIQTTTETERKPVDYLWFLGCGLITAVATFVRFFWLEIKPLHHDEGVNGYFLTTLFRTGEYKYDPANYHGPDLYYIALAFTKVFGLNTLSIRWSVAVFGVLTVAMAFFLRKYIGKTGSMFAALFIALSPGMAYISRYFIHEILFIFFSFGIVLSILFFIERRKVGVGAVAWTSLLLLICFLPSALNLANVVGGTNPTLLWVLRVAFFLVEAALVFFVMRILLGWRNGQPVYLVLASASAVLLFATKETAFITLGTMAIAVVCVFIWHKISLSEAFSSNRFFIFAAFSGVSLLGVFLQRTRIKEGFASVYENFELAKNTTQINLFYAILALIGVTAITWIVFALLNRNSVETDLADDETLTWRNFLTKFAASSTSEFVMFKSAIAGATIVIVWFLVRIGIELLVAWKAEAGVTSTFLKIALSKVDLVIVLLGLASVGAAFVLWMRNRTPKVSSDLALMLAVMVVVFLYVGALFFSSFFSYPEGLQKAFEAYAIWTKTGTADHTQNGFFAYVRWGMIIEAPLLILSALGTLIAFYKARHRFAMFTALWALGLFAAYTIIPYKTPWLALSFLLPMAIIGGYAINELVGSRRIASKILGGVLALSATVILAYQTYDINFVRYDSDAMPYIYAHSTRGFLDLFKRVDHFAEKSKIGKNVKIEVISPDYWPMPWYLNDYPNAVFQGKPVDANSAEMIIAKDGAQDSDLISRYAVRYRRAGIFPLRPGVDLVLLVRSDLADVDSEDLYQVYGEPVTITPD